MSGCWLTSPESPAASRARAQTNTLFGLGQGVVAHGEGALVMAKGDMGEVASSVLVALDRFLCGAEWVVCSSPR